MRKLFILSLWSCICISLLELPTCARTNQYLVINFAPGQNLNQNQPATFSAEKFEAAKWAIAPTQPHRAHLAVSFIFSYFNSPSDDVLRASLDRFLSIARETRTPVLIQLDGEYWLGHRPDLWNWWDPSKPGFNPTNATNVEWTGWGPEHATKIGWLNWGRQIRVLPPMNLMSPRYRSACAEKMDWIVPMVLSWWRALPAEDRNLFVGLKVGWESSIGVNVFHYPNGNALLEKSEKNDPRTGIQVSRIPDRGVAQIGYAAVAAAGIRQEGAITEADLAEVARRHLATLSRQAAELGVPRERLFAHGAGWKEEELNYAAAVNAFSCPGWSFYKYAADPSQDEGVRQALQKSDAPFWAATEWLLQGAAKAEDWKQALEKTLSDPRCRYVCIFNWEGIQNNTAALSGIRQFLELPAKPLLQPHPVYPR